MNKQSLRSKDLNLKKSEETAYICEGSCNAHITQKRYDEGLTKCGAKDCTFYGKPFKKISSK